QAQILFSPITVRDITQDRAVLQSAGAYFERQRLRTAEHVGARNLEYAPGARADRRSAGIVAASRKPLDFKAAAVADGVTFTFFRVDYHGFLRIGAVRILWRDGH